MRFSAICTDPLDFTRILRLEFGLQPELDSVKPVLVAAVANVDHGVMRELAAITTNVGAPSVIMTLSASFKLDDPATMMILEPTGDSIGMHTGLTLWAAPDPASPLLIAPADGSRAFAITPQGLVALAALPLGFEATTLTGIGRASQRLTNRFLAIGQLRRILPLAA